MSQQFTSHNSGVHPVRVALVGGGRGFVRAGRGGGVDPRRKRQLGGGQDIHPAIKI